LQATEYFPGCSETRTSTVFCSYNNAEKGVIVLRTTTLTLIVATTFASIAISHAQESTPAAPANPNAAMQEMMKRMMPGEGHKSFASMTGKWRGTMKIWSSARPDAPPLESATESESKLVLGGRFVLEEATGTVMRMPMQRMSILGYDNATNQYTLIFYSSMETATNIANGTADSTGKVLTLRGEFFEGGSKVPFRNVIRLDSDDVHVFESYRTMPDGKELKLVEQVMTRVK
jgi:hypothetical protein